MRGRRRAMAIGVAGTNPAMTRLGDWSSCHSPLFSLPSSENSLPGSANSLPSDPGNSYERLGSAAKAAPSTAQSEKAPCNIPCGRELTQRRRILLRLSLLARRSFFPPIEAADHDDFVHVPRSAGPGLIVLADLVSSPHIRHRNTKATLPKETPRCALRRIHTASLR